MPRDVPIPLVVSLEDDDDDLVEIDPEAGQGEGEHRLAIGGREHPLRGLVRVPTRLPAARNDDLHGRISGSVWDAKYDAFEDRASIVLLAGVRQDADERARQEGAMDPA